MDNLSRPLGSLAPLGFLPRHTTIVDRTTEAMVKAHERQDTMARCVRHRVKRAFESSLFKVIRLSIYQQPHPPSVKLANCDSFPRIASMQFNMRRIPMALMLSMLCGFMLSGCKTTYYSAWEKFGVYKRDLLKKRVIEARDGQKAAGDQFKDALTRLKELYKFDGGKLEAAFTQLKSDYDISVSKADAVRKHLRDVESVGTDLFSEWQKEIGQISTPNLQASSKRQWEETKKRFDSMLAALKKAEGSMNPVLVQFKDHVLYLKHNLNAQAIASLKGEGANIQDDIAKLIAEMNRSIAQADEFVKALN